MLKTMTLVNFRGFESFRMSFAKHNYLIGPNNAGKSTILTALRLADTLLRVGYRKKPEFSAVDGERRPQAYSMNLTEFPALQDSVRYEFYEDEQTRFEIAWRNGSRLTAVWPVGDAADSRSFFYLETLKGIQPRSAAAVRSSFPPLGLIPVLTQVEHTESALQERYLRANVTGRLSSRHFRNNLLLMQRERVLPDFYEFVGEWMDEITLEEITTRFTEEGMCLDLFYNEPFSRVPKELVWAGDGVQIWLQILFHLFRIRDQDTVILDEPEVYLHPDLQRRMVRLLEDTGKQVIMATHSAEVITEIDPADMVLIDRRRRRGVRAKTVELEEQIGAVLGTQFNLRLAKALRSKVVVFVEGEDLKLLRPLFRTLNLTGLAREKGVSFVDLGGFSMWEHLAPFEWFVKDLLHQSVLTAVFLDRDYRNDSQINDLEQRMQSLGLMPHVWRRKEIESYLVTVSILARATKYATSEIEVIFTDVTESLETATFSRLVAEAIQAKGGASQHHAKVTAEIKDEFDSNWPTAEYRLKVVPPKQLLAGINTRFQNEGKKAVSIRALAKYAAVSDLDDELVLALQKVEDLL